MKNLIQQLHKSMQNKHFSAMQSTRFSNVLTPSVLVLFLFLFGVGNVKANYAYMDLTGFTSWYDGDAWFRLNLNTGNTNIDSKTEIGSTGVWRFNIGTYTGDVTYKRMQPNTTTQWNYFNGSISSTQNVAKITGWDASGYMQTSFVINYIHGTNYIYFDNSVSNFSGNLYFVIGHDYSPSGADAKYTKAYKMSKVSNTSNLWYVSVTDTWPDATYYAVIASSSSSISETGWGSTSLSTKGNNGYTAAYKTVYNMEGGSYLITTASSGNNKAMTITYKDGYASLPKVNATQSAKKRDTGTTYSTVSGTYPATLNLQGTYMSGNGATTRTTITSSASTDGDAAKTYGAVKTGLITHTYESLSDSYYFEGWGTGSTPSSTSSSYEYNITAATTVYAFFSKKYTLTYDEKGTAGTSTLSVEVSDFSDETASGSSIPTGHSITLTATPAEGYQLTSEQAWYSDAECTSSLGNGTNTTYTISSLDANSAVYAKFEAIPYTITYNLNGGNNHEDNPTSYNIETATITLQTPTYPGHTFIGWYANSACTGDAVSSIPLGSTGDKEYWAKWEENEYHFTASSGNNWSTTDNWSADVLPTIDDIVYIDAPVVVDITGARAKQVIIDQSSTNTGKITINPGKELVVAETVTKTTDGSNSLTTAPEDLVFNSDASNGLGALVTGTLTANQATVNFYTKSHGTSGSSASVAQYLGTPFTDATVLSDFYNSWVYKAKAPEGVGNITWDRLNGSDALNPFEGYCVISADAAGHTYEMQGTLVNSKTISSRKWYSTGVGYLVNNENLLANSWMAPIKINAFNTEDFIESYATIYIFNSGSKDDYGDSGEITTGSDPAQYNTYTVGTAKETDIIPAMQSFSVFTSGSVSTIGYVNLDYDQLVYDPALAGTVPGPNKAPRRNNMIADEAGKMYVHVVGESGYRDRVYLWQHEDFADGFENGWDGHKLFGESIAPQLYAQTPDGKMAVNCAPEFDGTILGFTKGSLDNTYTFRFAPQTDEVLYLNDMRTQTSTLINAENTYTFTAGEDDAARFLISRTPYPKMPTGVSDTQASSSKARKIFINGQLYVLNGNALFDITGKRVNVQ